MKKALWFLVLALTGSVIVGTVAARTLPPSTLYLPMVTNNYSLPCASFTDDFSTPGFWPEESSASGATFYNSGEYYIQVDAVPAVNVMAFAPNCNHVNYSVAADMRWASSKERFHGLVFGVSGDQADMFQAFLNANQQTLIVRWTLSGSPVAEPVKIEGLAAIDPDGSNNMKITVNNGDVSIEINGVDVGITNEFDAYDAVLSQPTGTGMIVQSKVANPPYTTAFDNYALTVLP